jgi:hypothetical protein
MLKVINAFVGGRSGYRCEIADASPAAYLTGV